MKEIALSLPGQAGGQINGFPFLRPELSRSNLGDLLSQFLTLTIAMAGVLLFFWLVWGVFEYIFAGGNKEKLGKARARITYALIGFVITIVAFSLSQYIQQIFPPQQANAPLNVNVGTQ